jgi:helicase
MPSVSFRLRGFFSVFGGDVLSIFVMPLFEFIPQTADQAAALQSGFLTGSESGSLILQTGSGKSRLVWVAMLHALSQNQKAIYVAPTKAVLEEQYRDWQTYIEQSMAATSESAKDDSSSSCDEAEPELEEAVEVVELSFWADQEPQVFGGGGSGSGGVGEQGQVLEEAEEGVEAVDEGSSELVQLPMMTAEAVSYLLEQEPKVGIFDGDHEVSIGAYPRTDLLLMTPERLDSVTRHPGVHQAGAWVKQVGVCIVDEAQILGDGHRGARLEGTIIRLRTVNPNCRLIALSAGFSPDDQALLEWIGEYVYYSAVRPVPLVWKLVTYTNQADQARQVVRLLREQLHLTILFVSSRSRTERVRRQLEAAGIRAEIHHAGLSVDQRRSAEANFKRRQIQVLVATSTLATGVNLPARQVVVYDLYKPNGRAIAAGATDWNDRNIALTVQEVQQMAGRAGRPGLDPQGDVVILAHERERWARTLLPVAGTESAAVPNLQSVLFERPSWIIEQIVALVAGGYAATIGQLQSVFAKTLGARQGNAPDLEQLVEMVMTLRRSGLIETNREGEAGTDIKLSPTPLAQVCATQYLMPATAVRWRLAITQVDEAKEHPACLDWLALASQSADLRLLGSSVVGVAEAQQSLWLREGTALARLSCPNDEGRAGALYSHAAILIRYTHAHGNLQQVMDWVAEQCRRTLHLNDLLTGIDQAVRSIGGIVAIIEGAEDLHLPDVVGKLKVLSQRLKTGLSGDTVSLTLLKGVGVKRALVLSRAGIQNLAAVAIADPDVLAGIKGISAERAAQIVEQARKLQTVVKQEWFED